MIINILISTFLSLRAHKLRVFLTMVGIIIGITSVVCISTLGAGMKKQVMSANDTNANIMKIQYSMEDEESDGMNYISYKDSDFSFTRVDLKKIKDIKGIDAIYPDYGGAAGGDNIDVNMDYFGAKAGLMATPNTGEVPLAFGRQIESRDANRDVIILDYSVFDNQIKMDKPEEMVNQAVSINGYMYKVIGIKEKFDYNNLSQSESMELDWNTVGSSIVSRASYNELAKSKQIQGINLKLKPDADRQQVLDEAVNRMTEAHPEVKGIFKENDSAQQQQKMMEDAVGGMTGFLMAITAISLLVGGIGVMNIMYVSVTERKREIGIRRAIGAKPRTILLQFLLEAAFITLIGGLIGIALGYGLSKLLGSFVQIIPVMTPQIFIISTVVSIFTGILFGIIPAINAAKMDPIKAIYR
ncbi:ABC transporter permease [Carnobacterium divergens]|uniref:ABC transporter permease n=1 Tax=Carnobacterium divergens TaxID=2748 RepID=A0A2R8A1M0_CARDV|nr:FtsX-like permease family protein [Carnobacterium divergens]MCO6017315.1 ABC transporter permease [Carnobacterium divergens]MPQ21773.1 FtsX-like permease family protein [Carnobacterium divergens]TFI61239.1 ABC transporter permease [Carnobacterium divergens]TFI70248.1 ABC transporter permease [Carnobacterium divergens]TFI75242.1 ABC transporter permease [Carnobacterium divergens]